MMEQERDAWFATRAKLAKETVPQSGARGKPWQ